VEFYNGTALINTQKHKPYTWSWQNVSVGKYTITAKSYYNSDAFTISLPVTISVLTQNKIATASIASSEEVVSQATKFAFTNFDVAADPKGNLLVWSAINSKS